MNVRSYGSAALLVELESSDDAVLLRAQLDADPPPGVIETMPGLRTVLVRFDPTRTDGARLLRALGKVRLAPPSAEQPERPNEVRHLRVDYSGPDLAEVAERAGLTPDQVVEAHQAGRYRVALIGMAPGFYFLAGGNPRLYSPRRASPRTDVPKGALGLAGEFTGIYPRLGPGGWQLIGRVLDDLWHPDQVPAALLAPGTAVRFSAA